MGGSAMAGETGTGAGGTAATARTAVTGAGDVGAPPEARPAAAVLIPHKDDAARLALCLASVEASVAASGLAVEIVVCDNGSAVDLGHLAAAHPDVLFLEEPDGFSGAARNRAWAASRAPILISTDADCIVAEDFVAAAVARIRSGEAEIYGGRVEVFDETPGPRTGAQALETALAFPQERYIREGKFSVTANLVTTRDVFERVGAFAHEAPDDKDWCVRAHKMGFRLAYAPEMLVHHPTRGDFAALRLKARRLPRKEARRKPDGVRERLRRLVFVFRPLKTIPRDIRRILACERLDGREKRAAIATLFAISAETSRAWLRLALGLDA